MTNNSDIVLLNQEACKSCFHIMSRCIESYTFSQRLLKITKFLSSLTPLTMHFPYVLFKQTHPSSTKHSHSTTKIISKINHFQHPLILLSYSTQGCASVSRYQKRSSTAANILIKRFGIFSYIVFIG